MKLASTTLAAQTLLPRRGRPAGTTGLEEQGRRSGQEEDEADGRCHRGSVQGVPPARA
jgi:hypothetical protein